MLCQLSYAPSAAPPEPLPSRQRQTGDHTKRSAISDYGMGGGSGWGAVSLRAVPPHSCRLVTSRS
ncbi:hypothetical protein FAIPA1_90144 [Frankia sp. AiPs1]